MSYQFSKLYGEKHKSKGSSSLTRQLVSDFLFFSVAGQLPAIAKNEAQ